MEQKFMPLVAPEAQEPLIASALPERTIPPAPRATEQKPKKNKWFTKFKPDVRPKRATKWWTARKAFNNPICHCLDRTCFVGHFIEDPRGEGGYWAKDYERFPDSAEGR